MQYVPTCPSWTTPRGPATRWRCDRRAHRTTAHPAAGRRDVPGGPEDCDPLGVQWPDRLYPYARWAPPVPGIGGSGAARRGDCSSGVAACLTRPSAIRQAARDFRGRIGQIAPGNRGLGRSRRWPDSGAMTCTSSPIRRQGVRPSRCAGAWLRVGGVGKVRSAGCGQCRSAKARGNFTAPW